MVGSGPGTLLAKTMHMGRYNNPEDHFFGESFWYRAVGIALLCGLGALLQHCGVMHS